MLNIIAHRKIYFIASGLLCLASILSLAIWGLKPAIDFTGGTLMEIEFKKTRPSSQEIREALADLDLENINIQEIGEKGMILRMKNIDEKTHQEILKELRITNYELGIKETEKLKNEKTKKQENKKIEQIKQLEQTEESISESRFESIGPVIGKELKIKTIWAISLVVIAILIYIAWAFRKVGKISYTTGVASWKYGLGAIIALMHDILIPTGVFAVLGHFAGIEVDLLFITALLTILGFSVHDTIVVYDRTRENLGKFPNQNFETTVNQGVNETMTRSINTSLTVLLTLLIIFFLGSSSIKNFALALIIGIVLGTYSSIFIASALLVVWQKMKKR